MTDTQPALNWYWVTWADRPGTDDAEFLGVNIIRAADPIDALIRVQQANIGPGSDDWQPAPNTDPNCPAHTDPQTPNHHRWRYNPEVEMLQCLNGCGVEAQGARQIHGEAGVFELPQTRPVEGQELAWDTWADRLLSQQDLEGAGLVGTPA